MKPSLENAVVGVLLVSALGMTGLVARREFTSPPKALETQPVKEWKAISGTGERLGASTATAHFVVFSDYQCPYCKVMDSVLEKVRRENPTRVEVVYRHFPLESIHPYARSAALAAECAATRGKFSEYHHALFQLQDSLPSKPWDAVAARVGIADPQFFASCEADATAAARVAADIAAGDRLQITATPTVLFNGSRFLHSPSAQRIEELVTQAR